MNKEEIDFKIFDYITKDEICSNFDGIIDREVEEELKNNNCYSEYPGWNFFAKVWFDKETKQFGCVVKVYGSIVEVFYRKTIDEIVNHCCEKYGYE